MKLLLQLAKLATSVVAIIPFASIAGPNPITWDKMAEYVQIATTLSAADWAKACSSGSPNDAAGCYGNPNSLGFAKVNRFTGGFLTVANVDPTDAPANSIYIKAFYAGTNTPQTPGSISVTLTANNMARCGLYMQQGTGLDTLYSGSINSSTSNNSTAGPVAAHPVTVNAGSVIIGVYSPGDSDVNPQQPLYLVCGGVETCDGSTAASILNQITAL
jgi:hypothetical protein